MIPRLFQPPCRGGEFFLIAGPCALETDALHAEVADALWEVQRQCRVPVIFKGSFDKANRRGCDSPRGPGLEQGLRLLDTVREEYGLPVLTDVHTPEQVRAVAEVCDVLQIPAALCRQTDMLAEATRTGRALNLKKGQWVSVAEMQGAVEKVRSAGGPHYPVAVTERGTFFGYGDLVVDMRNMRRVRCECAVPVVFDGTHSVQRPAQGEGGRSGGGRQYIAPLVLAAVAAGASALFLEVHPRPETAPSDAESMLPLDQLLPLMWEVMALRNALLEERDVCGCQGSETSTCANRPPSAPVPRQRVEIGEACNGAQVRCAADTGRNTA